MESDTGGLELLTYIDNLFSDPSHADIDMDRVSPELAPLAERLQELGGYVSEGVSLATGLAEGNLDLINEEHYNPNNPLIPSLATIRTTLAHTLEMAKNVATDAETSGNSPEPLAKRTAETDYATAFDRAIEDLRRQNQTLERNALTDPLTNLGNRAAFNRAVDLLWSAGDPFTVAFVDIDNLKYCNDTFGHSAGNFYIKQVALYLRLCAEEGEQVFRIGGDEFVLLSPSAGERKLEVRLEHYRQMLMKSKPENGIDMVRSFSFGCSRTDPSSGDSRRQMTVDADRKMYGYKLEHKDSLTPCGDTQLESLMSLGLEDRVFQALAMTNDGRYLFVYNIDKNISRWSLNAVRDFDLPSEHMRDAEAIWAEHIHPDDREAYAKDIEKLFEGRKHHHSMQYRVLDASGRYVLCECKGYRLDGNDKMPGLFVGSIINRARTESTDLATGLNGVRGLIATISECRRTKEPAGFVSIKFDGIADYNGNFGYDTGDGILAEISGRVVSLAHGKMRVFRRRGTTIVVTMVGAGPEDPQTIKEQLRRALGEPVVVEGRSFSVRTHIACTHYPSIVSQPFAIMTELTRRLRCVAEQERAMDGGRAALDDDLDPLTGVNREGIFLEKPLLPDQGRPGTSAHLQRVVRQGAGRHAADRSRRRAQRVRAGGTRHRRLLGPGRLHAARARRPRLRGRGLRAHPLARGRPRRLHGLRSLHRRVSTSTPRPCSPPTRPNTISAAASSTSDPSSTPSAKTSTVCSPRSSTRYPRGASHSICSRSATYPPAGS